MARTHGHTVTLHKEYWNWNEILYFYFLIGMSVLWLTFPFYNGASKLEIWYFIYLIFISLLATAMYWTNSSLSTWHFSLWPFYQHFILMVTVNSELILQVMVTLLPLRNLCSHQRWIRSKKNLTCIQLNIFQKHLFLPQLTHNMTKDCSLNHQFSTWKFQAQNMLCT